ncbi:MAG: hypothetical protein ABSE19_12425 [Candidatus Acidiferrum sp.]
MLANRIPPDVAGNGFEGIRGAEDVVVVTFLPEPHGKRFPEFEGGVLLEEADEFTEVRQRLRALCQKVQMVWHDAKGVEKEKVV